MNSIILIVNTSTFFPRLIEVAVFLKNHNYFPVLFFDGFYPTIQKDLDICEREGIKYELNHTINLDFKKENLHPPENSKNVLQKIILRFNNSFNQYYNKTIIPEIREYYKIYRYFDKVFRKHNPELTILVADMAQHNTAIQIRVTQNAGRKVLIMPSFMASYKEPAGHYYNNPSHDGSGFWGTFIDTLFPKWILLFNNKKLLRLPVKKIIVKELFALTPPDPWTVHSGKADAIAVEGEAIKKYCIREGIPGSKIHVTGSISNDILYDITKKTKNNREYIAQLSGFDNSKPIILSSVPPNMFYSRKAFTEFKSYDDFLQYWVQTLCKQNTFNVLLSLHPSVKESEFKFLEKFGCTVMNKPILNFIPVCDLFVASVSSTIQWAIACGKPVINYDEYKYYYDDYDEVESVLFADNREDFEKHLSNCNDKNYLDKISGIQHNYAASWGMLDGKSGDRILKLINQLH